MFLVEQLIVKDTPKESKHQSLQIGDQIEIYCSDQDALTDTIGQVRVHVNGELYTTTKYIRFKHEIKDFEFIKGKLKVYLVFGDFKIKYAISVNQAPDFHDYDIKINSVLEISREDYIATYGGNGNWKSVQETIQRHETDKD